MESIIKDSPTKTRRKFDKSFKCEVVRRPCIVRLHPDCFSTPTGVFNTPLGIFGLP
jgi:hypothetical protein